LAGGGERVTDLPTWESGLLAHFGITTACCVSCAQDSNAGYEICSVDLPDGTEVEVCCSHATELRDRLGVWRKAGVSE
jgi:hypothetical protein